jgi:Xaa-Pro dipeptidase
LQRFRGTGGIRLEDVVLVTENGSINLTNCPRTVNEIESVNADGPWPPVFDEAPFLKRKWTKLSNDCKEMIELNIPFV